ncbi:MAG TPA: FAD-linked oxidase [Verrucomicrobia bacterium]|nr:MAG: hypothetical protein A2X46_15420 [Lentisphaerae bacterium GWF2_57_35]HBA85416.1 FAD-linked oxidase [Verrucomicrobiota bacterium]
MSEIKIAASSGEVTALPGAIVDQFKSRLEGVLILPSESVYDDVRAVWNGMIDRKPALIVQCHSAQDVVACINFARDQGVRLSVRGGGHNVAGSSICDNGLVVDLSDMAAVEVEASHETVVIEGGATLGEVDLATFRHDLATPMGVVTATGYAGLTLHGGMGWQLREHGLAADNVVGVEIVTADGRLLKADANENPDLWWALRGGGGSFGVVTSFRSRLYPMPKEVLLAVPVFSLDRAGNVLRFMREFMAHAPDKLMVLGALWTVPDKPEIPSQHIGEHALFLLACYLGDPEEGERVVAPLRHCEPTIADLTSRMNWLGIQQFFDDDYPNGRRYYWKSTIVNELTDAMIDALIEHTLARPSLLTSIDIWKLGGAYGRVDASATAFGDRSAGFVVNYEANWEEPDKDQANIQWARNSLAKTQSLSQARTYLNFAGLAEEGESLLKAAYGKNYARLQAVKQTYDPDNLFRSLLTIFPR